MGIRIFIVVVICILLPSISYGAPAIKTKNRPCIGFDEENNQYIKIDFDGATTAYYGNDLYIYIMTGSGLIGKIAPHSITPSSYGAYTYIYYTSDINVTLPLQCYTVYVYPFTLEPPVYPPGASVEVCPCFDNFVCDPTFYLFVDDYNSMKYTFSKMYSQFPAPSLPTYYWTFGDGTSSTQIIPNHTYTTSGVYTVCLTLSYEGQPPCVYCQNICVNSDYNE